MTTIRPEVLDELLAGYERPEDLLGEEGLFKHLKKALLERALGAELSMHLGYEKGDPAGRGTGNSRNGYSDKTVLSEDGEIDIAVPRDRTGSLRAQDPGPRRYPDCGRRRAQGLPRGDLHRISADDGADLHRPSDPQLAGLRLVEGPQEDRSRHQGDLPRRDGRGCGRQAQSVRGQMGRALPGDRADLAAGLGARGADVCLPAGDPQDDLHHQCAGEPASVFAQDHQDPGLVPDRPGRDQASVPGDPQRRRPLAQAH